MILPNRMPYTLRRGRCRGQNRRYTRKGCFWVVGPKGKKYSRNPIPKPRANAQMRLLRAVEHGWKPTGRKTRRR
jgi:hypothetical protein